MMRLQILKQIIVTGGQVITACRVGNCRLLDSTALPDLGEGAWGLLPGPRTSGAHVTSQLLVSVL